MKITNVRLVTDDYARLLAFYRDTVGLPLKFNMDQMSYAYFEPEGAGLEIITRESLAGEFSAQALGKLAAKPQTFVELEVDNVDASYAAFVAGGATALAEPQDRTDWSLRIGHVADPDGNIIELFSRLG